VSGLPQQSQTPRFSLFSRLTACALGLVLAVAAALFFAVAWRMLAYPHEVIVTEGAIGLAVRSLTDGLGLYDPARWQEAPFVIIHYTPLYYLITAAWVMVTGGGLFAGRWISILATTGAAMVAGHLVRKETGRVGLGLMASALWLSFYQVVFWGTTQRVDALGTFFEALGLLVFAAGRRRGRTGYLALPFLVAAWGTKQVMIVALVAATLDLALEDKRQGRSIFRGRAVRFAGAGFGALAALFAGLLIFSGGGFWTATVMGTVSAAADPPWVIFSNAELFFGSPWNMVVFMMASIFATLGFSRRPGQESKPAAWSPFRLLGLYLWLGLALAIATDANLPRFFPPMLAMAMLVPLGLHHIAVRPRLRAACMAILVFTGSLHLVYEMRSLVRERIVTLEDQNQRLLFAAAATRHAPGGGPVLAQDAGMLISAGLPVTMADPYVFSILAGNDAWRPDILVDGIQRQRYETIILNRPAEDLNPDEWTTLWIAPARDELLQHYRLAETVTIDQEWRFLEPTRYYYVPREEVTAANPHP